MNFLPMLTYLLLVANKMKKASITAKHLDEVVCAPLVIPRLSPRDPAKCHDMDPAGFAAGRHYSKRLGWISRYFGRCLSYWPSPISLSPWAHREISTPTMTFFMASAAL